MAKTFGKISKRYARALFELCKPEQMEPRREALRLLSDEIALNQELSETLNNPAIPPSQREAVMRDVCNLLHPNDQVFANFAATLLQNGRLQALPAIVSVFSQLIEQFLRTLALEITSAFPLSDGEKQDLQSQVQAKIPASLAALVSIAWRHDEHLIGGIVVKAGDKILDGSLAGSLDRVARTLQ